MHASKPFFCWMNTTRMHLRTHVRADHRDKPGLTSRTEYADGMIEHDNVVGTILKAVDDVGIGNDTIVLYTTDNGPHQNSWPDAGTTPFRSEKNTNWEGAFRVPCIIRWPGHIQPGSISNETVSALDWLPTFMAAVGEPGIKDKLLKGYQAGSKTFKVPSRRLQPAPVPHRPAGAERTQRVLLFQRRWRPGRAALRKLEVRVRGAARNRHHANLGRAVYQAACP
jgi:arylsulfatase A-like enzyme